MLMLPIIPSQEMVMAYYIPLFTYGKVNADALQRRGEVSPLPTALRASSTPLNGALLP
jgi:hypothetical protein